jgi:hypothetical protein
MSTRKLLWLSFASLAVSLLYVGWVFYSRYSTAKEIEKSAEAEKIEQDRKVTQMYGNGKLKIVNFYATPAPLERGQRALLCYAVSNAKSVRIEPGIEPIKPSLGRCLEVFPKQDTKYTITAEDAQGHSETASFVLPVK